MVQYPLWRFDFYQGIMVDLASTAALRQINGP